MSVGAPTFYPAGPIDIRDGTAARLESVPGLMEVFSARTMPGQESQLPYAIVWNGGERTEPSGDANVGAPFFKHTLTLVIDVLVKAADETTLDADIVGLVEAIRATLMTDPTWVDLSEGIERCDTRYSYPREGQSIMAQATIEFEVTFRSVWEPVLPNDLCEVAVAVGADPRTQLRQSFPLPGTAP